jgi:acetyl esterase
MASTNTIPSDWSTLSRLNPEFASLAAKTFPPNFQVITPDSTIEQVRGGYSAPKDSPWPDVSEHDLQVTMRDGHENRIRVYTPKELSKGPLFVMIHGGGFCTGNLEIEAPICREFVRDHKGAAVSISYRLAPEHSWPIPVNDAWDAVQYVFPLLFPLLFNKTNINKIDSSSGGGDRRGC